MTIVKELNELAEKMTGTNPRATTDAQAMNFIEQNYNGGGIVKTLPYNMLTKYLADPTKYETNIEVTDESEIALFEDLFNEIDEKNAPIVRINIGGVLMYADLSLDTNNKALGVILKEIMPINDSNKLLFVQILKLDNIFYVNPSVYSLTSGGASR